MWRHKAIRQFAALLARPFKAAVEPDYSYSAKSFLYVPEEVWRAYGEACRVLHISPTGSATISRRCLQHLLISLGHNQKSLSEQIKSAARFDRQSAMTGPYRAYADAIRRIGNLAAHPSLVNSRLEPIEIEYEDAHWCLEMIEELFDFFYERPLELEMRTMRLEGRLVEHRRLLFNGKISELSRTPYRYR